MNLFNPTFALGIYNFATLRNFLENRPVQFIGLTPDGELDRYWRSTLVAGYAQDEWRLTTQLTVNGGVRVEWATEPTEKYGRDVALPNLMDREPTLGRLYQNPGTGRVASWRLRVGRDRRRPHVAPWRIRALLQHQQPAEPDRHDHEPAVHAAPSHRQPDVPDAAVRPGGRDVHPADPVRRAVPARPHLEPERPARAAVADGRDGGLRRLARQAPAAQQRRQHGDANHSARRHAVLPRWALRVRTRHFRPSSSRAATATPGTKRSSSIFAGGSPAVWRCNPLTPGRDPRTRRRPRRSSPTPPTARRRRSRSTSLTTTRGWPTSTCGTTGC